LEKEYDYGKETAWKFGLIHYRVGYGSRAIGGSGWQFALGKQSDDDSLAAIDRALELGVNWIDTAGAYGLGHSEEIVAKALATWSGSRPYQVRPPLGFPRANSQGPDGRFDPARVRRQLSPAEDGFQSTSTRSIGRQRI
jgi:aryl-alcohol dehydrogenase-like predicted oxidoreductase